MGFPNFPGIPPLLAGFIPPLPDLSNLGGLLTGDSVSAQIGAGVAQWGIFNQSGQPVIIPDSVVAVEYDHEWRIADYPVEQGGFVDYDKVQLPFHNRVTMTKGGSPADRTTFLNTLESIAGSLDLYNVVTPEYTYVNVNISHIQLVRKATYGAGMLTVEISLEEIRVTATSSFNSPMLAQSATPFNLGSVQALQASIPQVSTLLSATGLGSTLNSLAGSALAKSSTIINQTIGNALGGVTSAFGSLGSVTGVLNKVVGLPNNLQVAKRWITNMVGW